MFVLLLNFVFILFSFCLFGSSSFILEKDPFDKEMLRPFNARSETIDEKILFSGSWKYKRCLIPASGFFEKKYRIRKENYETFWLGGIWSKWTSPDGNELESCCVLTTAPNALLKKLHHRMPVVVPSGYEEQWTGQIKDDYELKDLLPMMMGWSPNGWVVEEVNKKYPDQMCLF